MSRPKNLAVTLVLGSTVVSCTQDLSSEPIIPDRSAPATNVGRSTSGLAGVPWQSGFCQSDHASDGAGRSAGALRFSGECSFVQAGPVLCQQGDDDFYLLAKRTLAGGQSFNFFINVERYKKPGFYELLAQIHVTVRDRQTFYRWTKQEGTATITASSTGWQVTLRDVLLNAEPGTPAAGKIAVDGVIDCVPSMSVNLF